MLWYIHEYIEGVVSGFSPTALFVMRLELGHRLLGLLEGQPEITYQKGAVSANSSLSSHSWWVVAMEPLMLSYLWELLFLFAKDLRCTKILNNIDSYFTTYRKYTDGSGIMHKSQDLWDESL